MIDTVELRYTVQRLEDNMVYVEYFPTNLGVENIAFHGQTLPIRGTIKQTVEDYLPIARQELVNALNSVYGGQYE